MSNKYVINPCKGFNHIVFGEKRQSVRSVLGEYKEFKKTKLSQNSTDDFGDFHIFYTSENEVEAVEFFEGNITIDGKLILTDKETALKNLYELDSDTVVSLEDAISKKLGISIYFPNETVESVLIAQSEYFN